LQEIEESNQKSNQIILVTMRRNPNVTIRELQEETGLSESDVKKIIRQLRGEGLVQRIGGTKGGHWEVRQE
jgi:ATP-dependent DNA helicase RecG